MKVFKSFLLTVVLLLPALSSAQPRPQLPENGNSDSFSYGNSADAPRNRESYPYGDRSRPYGNRQDPYGNRPGPYGDRGENFPDFPDRAPQRGGGWQARNLLQGPAAIVKGIGASVWCIGKSSYVLFHDVESVDDGFAATLVWPLVVVIDSVVSTAAYAGVGTAHTITFGALVSDPPKQIEEMAAPIYCVLGDNM